MGNSFFVGGREVGGVGWSLRGVTGKIKICLNRIFTLKAKSLGFHVPSVCTLAFKIVFENSPANLFPATSQTSFPLIFTKGERWVGNTAPEKLSPLSPSSSP